MVVDNSGNVYVTGYSYSSSTNNDYVTIKYNTGGSRLWLAKYNGPGSGSDVPNAIFVDKAGNVYVTGYSDALTGNFIDDDATTIKYSAQGTQLWAARYDGAVQRADAGSAVKTDGAGNVYITGYTNVRNGAYTRKDYLTVKYNSLGVQQWEARYTGLINSTDLPVAIVLSSFGGSLLNSILSFGTSMYVTGWSSATGTGTDYATVKYTQPFSFFNLFVQAPVVTSAGKASNTLEQVDSKTKHQLSNYPNPFGSTTQIVYGLPYNCRVTIKIYDEQGKQVSTLVDEEKTAGVYNKVFDASRYAKGVYYYQMTTQSSIGSFVEAKKMMVLK